MIDAIKVGGTTVYVDAEPGNVPLATVAKDGDLLPEGAEAVSAARRLVDSSALLKESILSLAGVVGEVSSAIGEAEIKVELGFAFRGETQIVPVLVKASGDANVRITLTWKQ
jgi:hypothetical protein